MFPVDEVPPITGVLPIISVEKNLKMTFILHQTHRLRRFYQLVVVRTTPTNSKQVKV